MKSKCVGEINWIFYRWNSWALYPIEALKLIGKVLDEARYSRRVSRSTLKAIQLYAHKRTRIILRVCF